MGTTSTSTADKTYNDINDDNDTTAYVQLNAASLVKSMYIHNHARM